MLHMLNEINKSSKSSGSGGNSQGCCGGTCLVIIVTLLLWAPFALVLNAIGVIKVWTLHLQNDLQKIKRSCSGSALPIL